MRRVAGLLVTLATTVLGAAPAVAAPSLEVRVDPPRIGVEDATRLVVRVHEPSGSVGLPELGELTNLELVGGPSTGNEIQVVNGRMSRTMSFTWVLRPRAAGSATIGPVTVEVDGAKLVSDPVALEVVAGSLAPPQRRSRPNPFDPFARFGDPWGRQAAPDARLELRHVVAQDHLVLGETVTVSVALDSTVGGIESFEWVDAPTYPGWWTQRVELPETITPTRVDLDGVSYNRFVIARYVLVALRAGSLEIPPVRARIGVGGRSLFAAPQVVERASTMARIEVAPRPPAPPGFVGAVGSLTYRAQLEPRHITLGESAVMTVTLRGTGNLPLVEALPAVPACAECDLYPPEEESDLEVATAGISGTRTWRTTVVPRAAGTLTLEPVPVAVFDPAKARYVEQQLGPFELVVDPPAATPTPTPDPGVPSTSPAAGGGDAAAALPPSVGGGTTWLVVAITGLLGALVGGVVVWAMARRRRRAIPARRAGQSSADRARELQIALEHWWIGVRDGANADRLRPEMEALRRELEAVRFAPGRADHSQTVEDLEQRLRRLV